MPPARITKVIPTASKALMATCLARIDRLFAVKKLGVSSENATSECQKDEHGPQLQQKHDRIGRISSFSCT